jgi:hypothetical protein
MRPNRVGGFLLATGVVLGVAAAVGIMIGFEPSRLPPALLDIAAYKLAFLGAGGLLAAGAIIRRRTKRDVAVARAIRAADDALRESARLPEAREPDTLDQRPPAVRVEREQ